MRADEEDLPHRTDGCHTQPDEGGTEEPRVASAAIPSGPEPLDQPGPLQHIEVVRHQVPGQPMASGQLRRRPVTRSQVLHDRQPGRLTESRVPGRSLMKRRDVHATTLSLNAY